MKRIILGGIILLVIIGSSLIRYGDRRGEPRERYDIPDGVGVVMLGSDMAIAPHPWWKLTNVMPNSYMLDDIASHGIRIASIWIRVNPFDGAGTWCWRTFWAYSGYSPEICTSSDGIVDEDMDLFWTNSDIDVIVVRFEAWSTLEEHCNGDQSLVWENEPTLGIVEALYDKYGDQDKVIIIQNWEADWQLHGVGCRERDQCAAMETWGYHCSEEWSQQDCCDNWKLDVRLPYLLRIFNERQRSIRQTREVNRDRLLRVYHSISINFYTDEWLTVAKDIIPLMNEPPDFVGVSFWKKPPVHVTDALEYVRLHTGLPRHRIYVAELGRGEKRPGQQYERLMREARLALDWGSQIVLVWRWKYWGNNETQALLSLFEADNETPRSGYWAVRKLNEDYQ